MHLFHGERCHAVASLARMHDKRNTSVHLEVLPELHDVGHVNLIEGGQHSICVL